MNRYHETDRHRQTLIILKRKARTTDRQADRQTFNLNVKYNLKCGFFPMLSIILSLGKLHNKVVSFLTARFLQLAKKWKGGDRDEWLGIKCTHALDMHGEYNAKLRLNYIGLGVP